MLNFFNFVLTVTYFHTNIIHVNNFQINKLYENNFEVTIINNISKLAISKIKTGMTISLGGGHNVINLAEELHQSSITNITLCSPSELTRMNCKMLGMNVHPLDEIKRIDLAFDGCDSVDYQLNALKSGGGIHLFEKIAAQMSKEYILLVPEKRVQKELSSKVPLCIEVAEPAIKQVLNKCPNLKLQANIRLDQKVAALARSPEGNLLIDAFAKNWREIDQINQKICNTNGVVATSYFKNLATSLITTNTQDKAIEIKKGDLND